MIKADTQQTFAVYPEEKMEVVSLQISQISEAMYLVSTIDDMGECCHMVFEVVHKLKAAIKLRYNSRECIMCVCVCLHACVHACMSM